MKRFKKYNIVIFCLVCVQTLLMSCIKENNGSVNATDSMARMPITLQSAEGASSIDKQIKTIRLIFFSQTGNLINNWLYNVEPSDNPSIVTGEMAIGMNNVYIICNETVELGKDLAKITAPEQVATIRFTPPIDGITDPVPMFCHMPEVNIERGVGSAVNVTVNGETKTYLEATVTRIVAKIGMKVIKNVPADGTNFSIEKLSYRICRLPAYSMLTEEGGRYPQGEGWGAEIKVSGQGSIAASSNGDYVVSGDVVTTNPTNLDVINCPAVYIPEHKPLAPENPDYCTYLLIEADCKTEYSSTPIRSVYRVNMGKLPPTDLSIERNVNYQVYLKITGLGATGFYAEIVPVDKYDLPITWKPTEGYAIVSEQVADYGVNTNIWNSYSQYSGILKVVKGKIYSDACFRYGSVVALSSKATAGAFDPATDILWMPEATKSATTISSWDDVGYMTSEDVSGTTHTLENIKKGKGDPCRLVGLSESEISSGKKDNELWRLPTKTEMQWLISAKNYAADPRGHYSFSTLLTPFNGSRSQTGEMVPANATTGHYWSSTAANAFAFTAISAEIATDEPQKAYGVRCVRTDIPESTFSPGGYRFNYYGGTVDHKFPPNNVLTPYWRMDITDTESIANLIIGKTEGSYKESNPITVKPLADPYKGAEYKINTTGYGFDGLIHREILNIRQEPLSHDVSIDWTSVPTLPESEGYFRIPVSGATISFTMQITPEPVTPYNPGFDDMLWRIECKYYTDVLNIVYGTDAKRGEQSVITFPQNIRNHILGIECRMVPVTIPYPPYLSRAKIIIQDSK